jgi:hypothetical protein
MRVVEIGIQNQTDSLKVLPAHLAEQIRSNRAIHHQPYSDGSQSILRLSLEDGRGLDPLTYQAKIGEEDAIIALHENQPG